MDMERLYKDREDMIAYIRGQIEQGASGNLHHQYVVQLKKR